MKTFVSKFEKDLLEASQTNYGGGLNTGDAWPDGLFTKYGERRYITAAGMPRGMVQIVAPAADSIYGGDGSEIPQPDLAGGTFKRTKITPEYLKSNQVIDPNELRDDTPPLAPKQRVYGRRAFGKSPDYTIPRESADYVFTGDASGKDILVKPTTPPEGTKSGGIEATPEPGSKELGSASGYRQRQKGGESILHDLDKLYIDKMLGKYDAKREGITEASLPVKVKQVKKTKGVKPPKNSKRGKEFYKHHSYHSGPHIQGKGAEHATYDFDDDDYEVEGGLQKRKDKQKRGYEPVESVNERKNPKREKLKKDFKKSLKFAKGAIRKIDTFMKSDDWGVVDGFVTNKRTGLASLVKDMEKSMNQIIKLPVDESVNETSQQIIKLAEKCWKGYVKKGMKTMFGKRYPNCVKKENTQRKMSSLEMQQIILLAKAMKQMPGSPAQKKIKQQINVIRKKLGQKPVKEATSLGYNMLLGGLATVVKKAGMRIKTAKMMGGGFKVSKRDKVGFITNVEIRGFDKKQTFRMQFEMERGMLYVIINNKPVKLGKYTMATQTAKNLKKVGAALIGSKGKPVRIA